MEIHTHKNYPKKKNLINNFLGGNGQKWVWPVWSWGSKIGSISEMNRWNKLMVEIQES